MRLVIANSALRASLAIYHLISNAHSWNNYGHKVNKQRYTVDIKLLLDDYITLASYLNLLCAKMAHANNKKRVSSLASTIPLTVLCTFI